MIRFSRSDGETIVFTREKTNDAREFWSIDPRGTKLKKLDAAPDWYSAAKSSPYFTSGGEEEAPSSSPTPPQEQSASLPRHLNALNKETPEWDGSGCRHKCRGPPARNY